MRYDDSTQQYTALIAGINEYLKGPLMLGNATYKPAGMIAVLEAAIAAINAIPPAKASWKKAVTAAQVADAAAHAFGLELKAYVLAVYGKDPEILSVFGVKPRTVTKPTVKTKAQAVVQSEATREARMTMGKRQRVKVKATTAPSVMVATTAVKA